MVVVVSLRGLLLDAQEVTSLSLLVPVVELQKMDGGTLVADSTSNISFTARNYSTLANSTVNSFRVNTKSYPILRANRVSQVAGRGASILIALGLLQAQDELVVSLPATIA